MFRYLIVIGGLALAALAVYHPAPRPQMLAGNAAAPATAVPFPRGSHRTRRRVRRRRASTGRRARKRRRRHAFNGIANVNTAAAPLLGRVPGIGAALASRIVVVRDLEGPYTSFEQLLDLAGMTGARLERARPYLRL